ncbi:ABC transporter permease [Enterococcus sp.]|uniref:ABC transporter permease n=1 Tax=Enterococcus sp. TaxID=35783 RepID=UPI0028AE73DC|nr:iron chelate uptake ABC transporter family permease subunit [Enterococcus sp.]
MKRISVFLLFCILMITSLFVGTHELSIAGLLAGVPEAWMVLVKIRLPRTISLVIAGSIVSLCGKVMQHLLQNKFVAAEAVGLSDSARLGILMVMLFLPNGSVLLRTAVAALFAYLGVLLFLSISRLLPKDNPMMLPLAGVMFGNIIGAVSGFLAYRYQLVQNVSSWLQGNFATITVGQYEWLYLIIPVFFLLYFVTYEITIAGLGEDVARSLGINYGFLRMFVLGLVAFASSIVLLMVGQLPFLGIVVPNMIGIFFGDHLKNNLWLTCFAGSSFLLICDLLARTVIAPYEMPVSVIAGMIGGSLFLGLLFWRQIR